MIWGLILPYLFVGFLFTCLLWGKVEEYDPNYADEFMFCVMMTFWPIVAFGLTLCWSVTLVGRAGMEISSAFRS